MPQWSRINGILEGLNFRDLTLTINRMLDSAVLVLGRAVSTLRRDGAGRNDTNGGREELYAICLLHLSLIRQDGRTVFLPWRGVDPNVELNEDGIRFLENGDPLDFLAPEAPTLLPHVIRDMLFDNGRPRGVAYNPTERAYNVPDAQAGDVARFATKLYKNVPLGSIFYVPVFFMEDDAEKLVGVLSADAPVQDAFNTQVARSYLGNLAQLLGWMIRSLNYGFFDHRLWKRGVFNQAYLWSRLTDRVAT